MTGIKNDEGKPEAIYFYAFPLAILNENEELRNIARNMEELVKLFITSDVTLHEKIKGLIRLDKAIKYYLTNNLSDLCVDIIDGVSKVSKLGSTKYGMYNYQNGLKISRLINALYRHFLQYVEGEYNDKESGVCHLYHMLANVYMITYMITCKSDCDDMLEVYGNHSQFANCNHSSKNLDSIDKMPKLGPLEYCIRCGDKFKDCLENNMCYRCNGCEYLPKNCICSNY